MNADVKSALLRLDSVSPSKVGAGDAGVSLLRQRQKLFAVTADFTGTADGLGNAFQRQWLLAPSAV